MGIQRVKGAIRTERDGISFQSRREARRWTELSLLLRGGEIRDLQRQVSIPLEGKDGVIRSGTGRRRFYWADFTYIDVRTGEKIIEDSKGFKTEIYELKRDILRAQGIVIREV